MNERVKIFLLLVAISVATFLVMSRHLALLSNEDEHMFLLDDYTLPYLTELNDAKVNMSDPLLIKSIREKFLIPPYPRDVPYNLDYTFLDPLHVEIAQFIAVRLGKKNKGFFVEVRALDGESHSNTIFLELHYNWTGLLVEPNPSFVSQIAEKKRKAWVSPSCPSTLPYPHVGAIKHQLVIEMSEQLENAPGKRWINVQCFPLYSLLLAMNQTEVGYLRLNLKGDELKVLRTIPFEYLNIKVLSVDVMRERVREGTLIRYIKKQGYELRKPVLHTKDLSIIFIFFKK